MVRPGPAEMPHRKTGNGTVHYDWHWIWDYGNGDLGNQGVHEMDKARWGLGKTTLPNSVVSLGGRFGYIDDGETANTQLCVFDYGDREADLRGPRPADQGLQGARRSATSGSAPTATSSARTTPAASPTTRAARRSRVRMG